MSDRTSRGTCSSPGEGAAGRPTGAYLSAALLVGLLANAVAGWWWADPTVALLIGAIAVREARDAWRGNSCSCC